MSDLHEFATAVLASWNADHASNNGPIPVADLLDRVFPYSLARRRLGIDVSEDYEALALRLLAGHEGLGELSPPEAAELARITMEEKLPDLAVLQLLRGGQLTINATAVPMKTPVAKPAAAKATASSEQWKASTPASASGKPESPKAPTPDAPVCWSCASTLPIGRNVKFCTMCGADQRQPVCRSCNEPLERSWKHCPECGERVESVQT